MPNYCVHFMLQIFLTEIVKGLIPAAQPLL